MRINLRSIVLAPVVMATVAFTANSAMAESRLNVPFSFLVNGQSCPAGQYSVLPEMSGNAVRLQGVSQSFTLVLHPGDPAPNDKRVILKFDEVGADHYLRSIQYRDQITSRLDSKTRDLEKAAIRVVQGQ
jgi:hypothetical protein